MPGHHFDQFSQRHIPVALRMKSRFVQIAWPESPQEPQVVMAVQSVKRDHVGTESFPVNKSTGTAAAIFLGLISAASKCFFNSASVMATPYKESCGNAWWGAPTTDSHSTSTFCIHCAT